MNDTGLRSDPANSPSPGGASTKKTPLERFDLVLTVIGLLCGVMTFAVFGAYFVKISIYPEGKLPMIACLLVFAGLGAPLFLRKKLRKWLKKLYIPAKAVYTFVILAFCVSYAAMCVLVLSPREETPYDELPEHTVVVVFGAKFNGDGSPGMPLEGRLRKAAQILSARLDAVCIVSGGKGDDEPVSEAEVMKNWLISAGIGEERIYVEDRSHNTLQNVRYSREIMEENGFSGYAVACVSSDFHIPRIMLIGSHTAFGDYYYSGAGHSRLDEIGLVREYLSFARLLILGYDS